MNSGAQIHCTPVIQRFHPRATLRLPSDDNIGAISAVGSGVDGPDGNLISSTSSVSLSTTGSVIVRQNTAGTANTDKTV
jgi:hypothetical protein